MPDERERSLGYAKKEKAPRPRERGTPSGEECGCEAQLDTGGGGQAEEGGETQSEMGRNGGVAEIVKANRVSVRSE